MFADYVTLVLADYHQKLTLNTLSPRLMDPKPAKLRDECMARFSKRHGKKDEHTLRIFFELKDDIVLSERFIEKFDIGKFKPLINFLKNGTGYTDPKNIELLAWLIDFQPRPFEYGKKYEPVSIAGSLVGTVEAKTQLGGVEEVSMAEQPQVEQEEDKPSLPVRHYGKPYFNLKTIVVLASAIVVMVAVGLYYGLSDEENPGRNLTGLERCMYWAGDHYEQVSCSQKLGDTMVIAYDSVRFHNLRKITKPDTITLDAVGEVWYFKKNNQFEYFTWGGYYPEDPKLRLKPITDYIITKHVLTRKSKD